MFFKSVFKNPLGHLKRGFAVLSSRPGAGLCCSRSVPGSWLTVMGELGSCTARCVSGFSLYSSGIVLGSCHISVVTLGTVSCPLKSSHLCFSILFPWPVILFFPILVTFLLLLKRVNSESPFWVQPGKIKPVSPAFFLLLERRRDFYCRGPSAV